MSMLLEVVAFNLPSAILAAKAGANRIEICDNYFEGGTTPSKGLVKVLRDRIHIPLVVMVRPRGGDFLYDESDLDTIREDILEFKQIGCDGVVVGCLNDDATVDRTLLKEFVGLAGPMDVHFNRAFDRVKDQFSSLETIIETGCKRILTSGGYALAIDGIARLKELVTAASDRITIIAGGGINSDAFPRLFESNVKEFHTPARKMEHGRMNWTNPLMNETLEFPITDEDEIRRMIEGLSAGKIKKQ